MLRRPRFWAVRYGATVAAVGIALLLRSVLPPWLGGVPNEDPFMLFFAAVIFASWFGGLGPGLVATALSALLSGYLFLSPQYSLQLTTQAQGFRMIMFALEGGLISWLVGAMHTARRQAEETALEVGRSERKAQARARQQEAVAQLGQHALISTDLSEFINEAVGLVARILDLEYSEVLELLPDGETMVLRAGVGWDEDLLSRGTFGAGLDSQAGYTLVSDEPVVVDDFRQEDRFSEAPFFGDHGVVSGITVMIPGRERPFGVLGAHAKSRRRFTRDDANFLRAVANVLAAAIERKGAEEMVEESKELLGATFEQAAVGIAHVASDGRLLRANQKLCEIAGYPREELLGMSWRHTVHPDDAETDEKEVQKLRDGHTDTYSRVTRHFKKDGSMLWVRSTVSVARDPSGEPKYYIAVVEDVTDRKRAEEALRESNRQIENILESITEDFYALDAEWRFTYINQRALDALRRAKGQEYTREELIGKNLWELLPELVGSEFYYKYHEALREQKSVSVEAYSPLRGAWVEAHASPSEGGLSVYLLDVTERKSSEETLRRSEERLRRAIEIETVGVIFFKTDGTITDANGAFLRMSGYSREDLTEGLVRWDTMTPPEWMPHSLKAIEELETTGRTIPYEKEYIRKDGSRWHALFAATRLDDEGGVEFIVDITERKQAQVELETRTRQQAAVAQFGGRALAERDLSDLMDEAVALVARTLGVEYAKIVELLPGGEELVLKAGTGWEEGYVGSATEKSDLGSQAGYTLVSDEPVIVEDLHEETRFVESSLLIDHGVVSGITVMIPGRERPFGVLGAHAKSRRRFTRDDANFLRAVANVLAAAIERSEVEKTLDKVREAERSRMARDLHDEALRDLADAAAEAQRLRLALPDPESERRLGRLVASIERAGQQLRSAIYDLRLERERESGFSELLEDLVDLHSATSPELTIRLHQRDGVLEGPLGEMGRELLRIVGEALTNARRHSGARNVRVAVWTSEDRLYAEVEDDGQGFDPDPAEEPSAGVGIRGMVERARALGGHLEIQSEPGKGTKVRFEVDVGKDQEQRPGEEVRVLLIDDHASFREALTTVFDREPGFEIVGQASSLAEARPMLEDADVAVVDLMLPDGYGEDLIRELRETNPLAQALVLSANVDRTRIARAVEAGAAGVFNKTARLEEVVEAVRRLRGGETLLPPHETVELLRFAGSRRDEEYEARQAVERLTSREIEVLQALAEGLGSQEIAERLHISIKTERNHMSSILSKLGVHSRLQALVFALRHGVVQVR